MAAKALIHPDALRQLLRYDPETGKLFWRERQTSMFANETRARQWNARCAGREALATKHGAGYKCGPVMNHLLLAHRVIFALVNGEWPDGEVDHINGDRADNRWCNLRSVSHQDNAKNRAIGRGNSSGLMGVHWNKANRCWIAEIKVDGVKHHLGSFGSKEAAFAARKNAEDMHGFHRNHGRAA